MYIGRGMQENRDPSHGADTAMAKIIITEFMHLPAVDSLRLDFDVLYDPDLHGDRSAIVDRIADASALIVRNRTKVDEDLIHAGPDLVAVGRLGVGLDNIDLEACAKRGITVHPATGANVVAVAEYVIGAILVMLRGTFHASEQVLAGEWPRNTLVGREIAGKTLGIVGFGAIGRAVAARAAALGMTPAGFDSEIAADDPVWRESGIVRHASLAALLATSDVVTLHVPLTDTTRHLVDSIA